MDRVRPWCCWVWMGCLIGVIVPAVAVPMSPLSRQDPGITARPHYNADWSANIFPAGSFRERTEDGRPAGWDDLSAFDQGKAIVTDHRHPYVRLQSDGPEGALRIAATADISPRTQYLTVWARTQVRGYSPAEAGDAASEPGDIDHAGCRVVVQPVDDEGEAVGVPTVHRPLTQGVYQGFNMPALTLRLDPAATQVQVSVSITNAKGWFEVGDIVIVPSRPDDEPDPAAVEALYKVITVGDAGAVRSLVELSPSLLEARSGHCDQGTPLVAAAWLGKPEVARTLLKLGAELEARDRNWQATALGWSGFWARPEVMRVLLRAGADASASNIMGGGPLDSVRFAIQNSGGDAEKLQYLQECERLLLAAKQPTPPAAPPATQPGSVVKANPADASQPAR